MIFLEYQSGPFSIGNSRQTEARAGVKRLGKLLREKVEGAQNQVSREVSEKHVAVDSIRERSKAKVITSTSTRDWQKKSTAFIKMLSFVTPSLLID